MKTSAYATLLLSLSMLGTAQADDCKSGLCGSLVAAPVVIPSKDPVCACVNPVGLKPEKKHVTIEGITEVMKVESQKNKWTHVDIVKPAVRIDSYIAQPADLMNSGMKYNLEDAMKSVGE